MQQSVLAGQISGECFMMSIKLNLLSGLLLKPLLLAGSSAVFIISAAAFCEISTITSAVDATLSARVPLSPAGMQKPSRKDLNSHSITMDEAVQIAIDNNLHVKAAIAQAGIALGELQDDALPENPFFEGSFERNDGGENAFTITAKQDITSLLFAGMKMRALASGKKEAILKATNEIYTLIGEVKRAFIRVGVLHKMVELHAAGMSAARAATSMAERQLNAGNINEIDKMQYRYEWHRLTLKYQQAITELQVAKAGLRMTIGLAANDTAWEIDILTQPPIVTIREDQLVAAALENRLDLKGLETGNDRLQIQQRAILAESFGGIEVGVGTTYESGTFSRAYPLVGITVPLFNRNGGKRMMMNSAIKKAGYEIAVLTQEIPALVQNAAKEYTQKRAAMLLLDTMVSEQALTVELAQKHYNVMTMGVYDLLLAKQREIDTKQEFIRAVQDAWMAYVNLEQVIGTTLGTIQK